MLDLDLYDFDNGQNFPYSFEIEEKLISDYVDCIESNIGKYDYIFISNVTQITNELKARGLCWILVTPYTNQLSSWEKRATRRFEDNDEDPSEYIKLINLLWETWTNVSNGESDVIILHENEYISNYVGNFRRCIYKIDN